MLLEDAYLQIHFLKDLVSLADPTSTYSFVNFLFSHGYIHAFLNRKTNIIHRMEFLQYMQWVAEKLRDNLSFSSRVIDVKYIGSAFHCFTKNEVYISKNIVVGTGTQPVIPECCKKHLGKYFFHNHKFKDDISGIDLLNKRVTVIGGGQSGAEVVFYLLKEHPQIMNIVWLSKRINFQSLDDSCFSNEFHCPNYVSYFYGLSDHSHKHGLLKDQVLTSDGITQEFADRLYNMIYHMKYIKKSNLDIELLPNHELRNVFKSDTRYNLEIVDISLGVIKNIATDIVILATGYESYVPEYLTNLLGCKSRDINLNFDYSVNTRIFPDNNKLFIQNISRSVHGISDSSLSLTSYRNAMIINAILGYEFYQTNHFKSIIKFRKSESL